MHTKSLRAICWWLLGLAIAVGNVQAADKLIAGWVEPVQLSPGGVTVKGKLDTGATTSSLHCDCITPQTRDGRSWVRFSVRDTEGKLVFVEREVVRKASIKRHAAESQERLVVKMGLCLANVYKEVEVTLVDRARFDYPLLVGRNFLQGDVLVDSAVTLTTKPSCHDDSSP